MKNHQEVIVCPFKSSILLNLYQCKLKFIALLYHLQQNMMQIDIINYEQILRKNSSIQMTLANRLTKLMMEKKIKRYLNRARTNI